MGKKFARGGAWIPKCLWTPVDVYRWSTRMHRVPLHYRRVSVFPLIIHV